MSRDSANSECMKFGIAPDAHFWGKFKRRFWGDYVRRLQPSTKVRDVAHMLKAIHAQEDRAAAQGKAEEVIDKLKAMRLSKAVELIEAHIEETFGFYAFPDQHWIKLKTNNPLERIMREIRRRTQVVGAFPDGQSALNLATARASPGRDPGWRHIAGTKWSTKQYMNMDLLKQQRMAA